MAGKLSPGQTGKEERTIKTQESMNQHNQTTVTGKAQRESEVRAAYNLLKAGIETLGKKMSSLETKIEPILAQHVPQDIRGENSSVFTAPFAVELLALERTINGEITFIEDVIRRVEI